MKPIQSLFQGMQYLFFPRICCTCAEPLSKNEQSIYTSLDKLLVMPKFQKLQNTISFIGTGYKNIGNAEIGPWFNWISSNNWEGTRFLFFIFQNNQ